MPEDNDSDGSRRRTFLSGLATAGAVGALPATARVSGAQEGESLDGYHRSLRDLLTIEEGLPEGEFVYGTTEEETVETFALSGAGSGTETEFDVSADVPFTTADRLEIAESPENGYDYTYSADVPDRSFSEGDVLLAVAYIRGDAAAAGSPVEAQAGFKYRYTNADGSTGYSSTYVQGTANVSPTSSWQRYYFPIEVGEKPDGTDHVPYLEFWTGFSEQTIEFGGVALVDYSATDVTVDQLPTTAFDYDYAGRAEDAEWRAAAEDRIDELRKTDFDVTVVDAEGNPVEGAAVDVAMREHDWDFGTAVAVNQIPDGNETYMEKVREEYNKAVPENGLKVPAWEGRYGESMNEESTRAAMNWLQDHDIPTRGHALVWSTYEWMGVDSERSAPEINEEVQRLITERATEYSHLPEWDMHNHPLFYPEIWQDIGREYILDWWAAAEEAAPDSEMYLNEMNIVAGNSLRQDYHDMAGWLLDEGVDLGGIGFMGHFSLGSLTPPEELLSVFDDYVEHGVPLQLTEFDIQINDRSNENEVAAQTDFLRDVLTAAFSHEAVEGVMSWGFWPDEHWRPTAAYYDSDWSIRPHGEEYKRLVFDEWWTEVSGETGDAGTFSARGFKGEYEVTARADGLAGAETVEFTDDGASVEVAISEPSVADVDVDVAQHTVVADDTVDLDVTLTSEDGIELSVPDGALSFESSDLEVLTVDEDGVVSRTGEGTATVSVTVSAYGDTAATSALFAAREDAELGDPALSDDASDTSVVESNDNTFAAGYTSRQGDDSFFQKSDGGSAGSITYRVPDGVSGFEVDAYVNNNATDSNIQFEVSADGDSFESVSVDPEVLESPSESNGYFAFWRYSQIGSLPDDATYLRVTIPEGPAGYAMAIGAVSIWSETVALDSADPTGPAIVVDGLQNGDTYEAPHPADVSVLDDQSDVTEQSVTLNGEDWTGGDVTARGRNALSASATSEGGVTTAVDLDFQVVDEDLGSLNARLNPSATQATVGDRLTFQVEDTTDGDWIESLEWEFGDGTTASGWWNEHRFDSPGAYTVALHATDSDGNTTTDEVVVWVAELESQLATVRPSTTEAAVDERVEFRVEDTTGQGRWIDELEWELGDDATASGWFAAHEFASSGTYTVTLTATDNLGYSTTDEVEITVS